MCDTFVALHNSTTAGTVIFGKNSDREPNEAHELCIVPAADHPEGSQVKCTYVTIPQVPHTYAVLLAKPFWIWGAEMGMNEHGVVIGNEAVFTKVPYETGKGLVGMDFIRLALERSRTAYEALQTITNLLETYGQGGNCGFTHSFYYHNSFILADPQEAWVLETAGKQWAAEKVRDVRSISNALTIGSEWDLASEGLVQYAIDKGWCKGRGDFHFARCYSDFLYTRLGASQSRQSCTMGMLRANQGQVTVQTAMDILRSHGDESRDYSPDRSLLGATVCMHAAAGPVRGNQTVGSMIVELSPELFTSWVTGTSAPCTSIFKPVWLDAGLPDIGPAPTGVYNQDTLWWRHEQLHREIIKDYANRVAIISKERDLLESDFQAGAAQCTQDVQSRRDFSATCFEAAGKATQSWLEAVRAAEIARPAVFYYSRAWQAFDRQAQMP